MSKKFPAFPLPFAVCVLILHFFYNSSSAQDIEVVIQIDESEPSRVKIEGKYIGTAGRPFKKNLSFLREFGSARNLGERFSNVLLNGAVHGRDVPYKQLIAGEYLASEDFFGFTYLAELKPVGDPAYAGHISWIGQGNGVLMLGDLLPQATNKDPVAARLQLYLPAGWSVSTTETKVAANIYSVSDIEKAVFVLGKSGRVADFGDSNKRLYLSGDWHFSDSEAISMAREIYAGYEKQLGVRGGKAQIAILKFPGTVFPGAWEADARGSSITILSSDMPFKSQSVQRLHEQLRHELFHLWIPNGVSLTGNYDWFYEGFALYQSLKLGVAVRRIRFDDFLDTLSRAYDIDTMQPQKVSLVEASKNRWNGSNTQVYARGMLVAFLSDLALLDKSKGRRSVTDLLNAVFARHRLPQAPQDGNAAVLASFRSFAELAPLIDRYITKAESIDWEVLLRTAGLEVESKSRPTKLKVTARPSGRQRDLLDKLGYNSNRKLSNSNR